MKLRPFSDHEREMFVGVDDQLVGLASYDPRPMLPSLPVPIHYLHGELDSETPVVVAETCAALNPGAGITVIGGSGHMPHQEDPRAFNGALCDALASMLHATECQYERATGLCATHDCCC